MQYNPSQRHDGKFRCNSAILRYSLIKTPMHAEVARFALSVCSTSLNCTLTALWDKPFGSKGFLEWYKDIKKTGPRILRIKLMENFGLVLQAGGLGGDGLLHPFQAGKQVQVSHTAWLIARLSSALLQMVQLDPSSAPSQIPLQSNSPLQLLPHSLVNPPHPLWQSHHRALFLQFSGIHQTMYLVVDDVHHVCHSMIYCDQDTKCNLKTLEVIQRSCQDAYKLWVNCFWPNPRNLVSCGLCGKKDTAKTCFLWILNQYTLPLCTKTLYKRTLRRALAWEVKSATS